MYGTETVGFKGFTRIAGEDESAEGRIPELIVPLRRFPKVTSSRGGVPIGEFRGKDALCGCKLSSSYRPKPDLPIEGFLMFIGLGGRSPAFPLNLLVLAAVDTLVGADDWSCPLVSTVDADA